MKFFILVILSALFFSCKPDDKDENPQPVPDPQLTITIQPYFGSEILQLDSVYTTSENYKLKFTDIKFFLSEVKNGANTLFSAAMFHYREKGTFLIKNSGNTANFSSLQGYIGINGDNHKDPSAFPNDSPLNIMNVDGMHWGWNPGYTFFAIEAKVDTLDNGIDLFDHTLAYHVGTDLYLKTFSFANLNWQIMSNGDYNLPLKLDLKQFLENPGQPINIKTEFITHSGSGQESLTEKAAENFLTSFGPL